MHNFIRPTQPKPQSQGAKQNDGRDSHYQSKEKFAEVKRVGNAEISGANHFAYQQQSSTTNDSTINGDSSSSNKEAHKRFSAPIAKMVASAESIVKVSSDVTPIIERGERTIGSPRTDEEDVDIRSSAAPPDSATTENRQSRKKEPQLDRENIVAGHIQRFMAHVETRDISKGYDGQSGRIGSNRSGDSLKGSSRSKSDDSDANKDNEDPNATY